MNTSFELPRINRSSRLAGISEPKYHSKSGVFGKFVQKGVQTDIIGDITAKIRKDVKSSLSMTTQTEEFMFPLEDDLKRKVMELIGGRL